MRVATWNVEWARPGTLRGTRVAALLARLDADVLVVTEGSAGLLPTDGHIIDAGDDWGYGNEEHRRKVLAWSRQPWTDVTRLAHGSSLGRVLLGRTTTPLGEVSITAVCIPWARAHVTSGRRDAGQWDEHIDCCSQLAQLPQGPRSILIGDFNQRIPRSRQPLRAADALTSMLQGWTVWTAGDTGHGRMIDHIATSSDLAGGDIACWPGTDDTGRLSDHAGVACTVREADAQSRL